MKENKRVMLMQEVIAGKKTVADASFEVEVSERQGYRILAKVREYGANGVMHGNKGRESQHRISDEVRAKVIRLRRGSYEGFNDRHFSDDLFEIEKIEIGRESVRTILRAAGIPATRKVKKRKHRHRRAPMERFGEMLQGDASDHDWLEGRGPRLTLVHFVDDATNYEWADLSYSENTESYYRLALDIFGKHGLPRMLYVDCHGVFKVNHEDTRYQQENGKRPLTQFGRAMQELSIAIIYATSPQAKGRVERRGGFNQDRLVSELRRAKVSTLEDARKVLKKHLRKINRRFICKPKIAGSAFTRLPEDLDLGQILCWKEERTVANDNTISFHGKTLQIPASSLRLSFAKAKVAVHLCLNGSIHVWHKHERIAYFKRLGVDLAMVPIISPEPAVLAAHSPALTFSLGH
jgi:hypothetical protein